MPASAIAAPAVRPHRGGIVFAVGVLSLFSAFAYFPIGIVAWILVSRELRGRNEGRVDPAGRNLTQIGWVSGIAGIALAFALGAWFFWMTHRLGMDPAWMRPQ